MKNNIYLTKLEASVLSTIIFETIRNGTDLTTAEICIDVFKKLDKLIAEERKK